MNRFAEVVTGLRERASGDKIVKALEGLEILRDLPDEGAKTPRMRLPYSSHPRSFEEPWK